jgi:beta-N-acetylhexosaminidase
MSTESLALRVLLASFPGTTLPADWAVLLGEGLGGICLFGSNTADGPAAVAELTAEIHAANPEAVVAVDEEGGDVTRLYAATASPVLGAAALGAAGDLSLTRATGRAVGADLAAAGIDLDLGPVADVNSNAANPVIGTRSFGVDPTLCAEQVAAWVTGLQETGVSACVKHFPGHGDTGQDSHLSLPVVTATRETLSWRELVPFAAAVRAGTAAVMTSHIVLTALDPERPATMSPVVLGLLRDELGFDGVIVSDALDMHGASGVVGIPEAAALALAAGADLLCIGPDKDSALVREIQAAIVSAVEVGRLPLTRLEEAARRVAGLPRAGRGAAPVLDVAAQLAGAHAATTIEGELPDLHGARVVTLHTPANIAVGEVPWGLPPDLVVTPEDPPVTGPVVVQVRDAHRRPEVGAWLERLGGPTVVVEWGWPGDLVRTLPRICPRGSSAPGIAAVAELLRKAGWDR